jgi:hypothetical protein
MVSYADNAAIIPSIIRNLEILRGNSNGRAKGLSAHGFFRVQSK